jgi:uncharacterized protein RhaS with RHS repeats
LDYADQRYYDATKGRFTTPDPYRNSAGIGNPGSFNRFTYVGGDPVNFHDPHGLDYCAPDDPCSAPEPGPSICAAGYYYDEMTGLCKLNGIIGIAPTPPPSSAPGDGVGSYLTAKLPSGLRAVNPAGSIVVNRTLTSLREDLDDKCASWLETGVASDRAHLNSWIDSERGSIGEASFEDSYGAKAHNVVAEANVNVGSFNILINTTEASSQILARADLTI